MNIMILLTFIFTAIFNASHVAAQFPRNTEKIDANSMLDQLREKKAIAATEMAEAKGELKKLSKKMVELKLTIKKVNAKRQEIDSRRLKGVSLLTKDELSYMGDAFKPIEIEYAQVSALFFNAKKAYALAVAAFEKTQRKLTRSEEDYLRAFWKIENMKI